MPKNGPQKPMKAPMKPWADPTKLSGVLSMVEDLEELNDADSDKTFYSSDKETASEVNLDVSSLLKPKSKKSPHASAFMYDPHPTATSTLAFINAQLEEIHGELMVVRKEIYEVHRAIADTRALVKMVDHHVKPKPESYVPIPAPPTEA
ncbi:uncharacterized protein G2W53_037177 [Senna tora]|uniref:Uncharacterized protein n=1 Tax=Senna tora TaxID=362788 RepID=A0A834T602_9FABA|nr:uncharacterized protein G2W53_037177 [Senna tora]